MSFSLKQHIHPSQWFYIQKPNPNAVLRLFCFPYAGGGTAIFRDWHKSLPNEIEVIAIRSPGRENRFNEEPISSLPQLVELLFQNILSMLDKPFVFFGHSNGALTCFELARLLQRKQKSIPKMVILSAKCPPHLVKDTKNISQLPDADFLTELKEISGTPQAILENLELMELLMPMLRADFALSENLIYQNDILLQSQVTSFYGLKDKITTAQIMAWQDLVLKPIQSVAFSGGHFFIDEQRDQVVSTLKEILTEMYCA